MSIRTNSISAGKPDLYGSPTHAPSHYSSSHLSRAPLSSRLNLPYVKSADWRYERKLRKAKYEKWSSSRLAIAHLILTERFDRIIALMAVLQLVLVVYETDLESNDEQVPLWVHVTANVFLAFYTLELVLSLFVWQSSFLHSKMNICDLLLICVDIITTLLSKVAGNLPSVSVLRVIRIVRVLRMGRVLMQFRELYFMIHGLVYALKAVAWAAVILLLLLTLWSVVAVKVLHPIITELVDDGVFEHCTRCGQAFKTVRQSNLTFFQTVVAGDNWGAIAVPVIEHHPWTAIIFCGVVLSVQLGVMNLILTVIVDSAMEARENDLQHRLLDKAVACDRSVAQLSSLCKDMDEDKNGYLTKEDLFEGYDNNMDFRDLLEAMDADREDIDVIFEVLDADRSGSISHSEFVAQLHKMKTQDVHTLLVFIKCHLGHIRRDVEAQMHLMKDELLSIVQSDHMLLESDHMLLTSHWGEGFDASDGKTASAAQIKKILPKERNLEPSSPQPPYSSQASRGNAMLARGKTLPPSATYISEASSCTNATSLKLQPLAEGVQGSLHGFQQNFDESLDMMLQDALKKVEDQTAALRLNCQFISSLNKSLTKALSKNRGSLSGSLRRGQEASSASQSSLQHAKPGEQEDEHLVPDSDDSFVNL